MRIINKVSNLKCKDLNFNNPYTFPTYKSTGDNSFMLALISGIRNAGKSTLALNVIELDKEHLLKGSSKVYFISPTKDAKVEYFVDTYPDHFEYVDELTKPNLERVLNQIKTRVEEWKEKLEYHDILKRYLKNPNSISLEELDLLEQMNYFQDDELEEFDPTHPPISTLILDDSVGVDMICEARSKNGKWFQKFVLKHRHFPYYCNVFILTQHIKSIAKYFRTNCNWTVLFPFRDFNVLKSVFDEYSILFEKDINNFLKLMDEIRQRNDHSFVSIYYDKIQYIKIGFNELVEFKNEKNLIVEKKTEQLKDKNKK
jgi:hypothetical protein